MLDFNETCSFSIDFRNTFSSIKFHENPTCGFELFLWSDRQTDSHDEFNSRFLELVSILTMLKVVHNRSTLLRLIIH